MRYKESFDDLTGCVVDNHPSVRTTIRNIRYHFPYDAGWASAVDPGINTDLWAPQPGGLDLNSGYIDSLRSGENSLDLGRPAFE